jgi:small subunit ribosomal protein S18
MTATKGTQKSSKRPSWRGGLQSSQRRKYCYFCKEKIDQIDYKNYNQLRRFISDRGKIRARRVTGTCRRHQRQLQVAIKRAREMALLPYVVR